MPVLTILSSRASGLVRRLQEGEGRHQLLAFAVCLATVAQWLADKRTFLGAAVGLAIVSATLYALATSAARSERLRMRRARIGILTSYLVWALAFAALAFFGFQGNRITFQALLSWALAVVLCLHALPARAQVGGSPRSWGQNLGRLSDSMLRIRWTTWGLMLALLLGAFFRFHRLLEIPADLGWDLPYNYTDAQRILRGDYFVFFPDNFGREGMFFYLIAAVAKLMKLSPYSIRITSALVGVATIPAVYMLARELGDRETAAYASLLLAVNKWHIVLSRAGYRVSLMPLFSALALYGLARGLRRGRPRDWAWCGLFTGLGLWTYKAFTFMVPILAGTIILYALLARWRSSRDLPPLPDIWAREHREVLRGLALFAIVAIVTATPMIRFVVDSPDLYLARELQASKLVSESMARANTSTLSLYARNTLTSLLMFNYEGDANARFGVPFQRHMGFVSGVLFVLGLAGAFVRWRRGGNLMLAAAVLGLLAPMIVPMLAGEKPNLFRSSGAIGPALVLAALALASIRRSITRMGASVGTRAISLQLVGGQAVRARALTLRLNASLLPVLLIGVILLAETRESSRFYFQDFRRAAPDRENYSVALELARAIIAFEDGPTFIKTWPHWYDGRAAKAHLDAAGRAWTAELYELNPNSPPLAGFRGKMLVLMHPEDRQSLATLEAFFPRRATTLEHYYSGEPSFIAFYGQK